MLFYFAFVVILSSFCSNLKVHGRENCVLPTNWNGSGVNCHPLQFYAEHKEHYFVKNSTFNFLPGQHIFVYNLTVENVTGLKLQAAADKRWGQSTPIVNCSGNYSGFVFSNVSDLEIRGIHFTECGQMYFSQTSTYTRYTYRDVWNATLVLSMVTNFSMIDVSITKSNGYGILGHHVFNSSIKGCLLEGNKGSKTYSSSSGVNTTVKVHGGNMELYYNKSCRNYTSYFDIINTTMRAGESVSFASGLDLVLNCLIGGINIRLKTVNLSHNSGYGYNVGYHEGGNFALQILLSQNAKNSVSLVGCIIEYGHSHIGSGMYVAAYIHSPMLDHHNALEINSTGFFHNTATVGAAIHMRLYYSEEQSNTASAINIELNNCHFKGNQLVTEKLRLSGGVAVDIISFKIQGNHLHLTPQYRNSFTNCTFENNVIQKHTSVGSGILYFEEHPNVVFKNCTIRDNNSTGISAVHSNIHFIGENTIERNTAMRGGGLLLNDYATILLSENSTLNISNNTAMDAGGGIFAEFGFMYALPICFFQFDVSILLNRRKWNNTRVYLHNNNASTGTAVYGGQIDNCYFLVDNKPQTVKMISHLPSGEIFNNTFKYALSPTRNVISSDPLNVCFCKNDTPVCNENIERSISPGETFTVAAVVVGQRQGNVSGYVVAQFSPPNNVYVNISQNETLQQVDMKCTNLTYTVHSQRENIKVNLSLRVSVYSNLKAYLPLHITRCPIGFTLNAKSMKCDCVPRLLDSDIHCNAHNHTICRPANFWIGYNVFNKEQIVINYHCPRLYCRPYNTDIKAHKDSIDQDSQCYLEREGVLCGRCRQKRSMVFGTPRCIKCQHFSIWATFGVLSVCALAGLVLVAFLLGCNITVTEGTLNGFIFCGNLIQANQDVYFPLGPTAKYDDIFYECMRTFIAWLNLDIGAELCFFNGMDTLTKTWLQFVFPIYIWCIAGLLIWLSRKYRHMTRLMKNNGTKVLATLILLSYTKIARVVMTSLAETPILTQDHSYTVWYFDGSVQYFSGRHILLFLTAVVFSIILLPFTFILLFIKHLPRFSSIWIFSWVNKLKPFFDAYTGPYTDEFRFWMGFQLLIRIVLLFCTGFHLSDYILLMAIIGICALILSVNFFYGTRIYKKRSLNCLEAFLLLNLICWSMVIAHYNHPVKKTVFPALIFLAFCGVICYHTYKLYIRELCTCSCGRWLNKVSTTILNTRQTEEENRSEQTHLLPNVTEPVTFSEALVTDHSPCT